MSTSAILFSVLSAVSGSESLARDVAVTPPVVSQDEAAEKAPWSGSINFGFTKTSGNTDNESISLTADATRESGKNRYTLGAFYNYAETDGKRTERNVGGSGQYDYLAGEKYYYFATAAAEADKFADLDLRWWTGVGVGYAFRDDEKMKLNGEVGIVYFVEDFDDDVDPDADSESVSLKVGYDLDYAFSEKTRFTQDAEAYPAIDDFSDVFVRVDSRLVTNLTKSMLGSIQYVVDWDNTPASGVDSTDQRFVISLGWAFGS